MKSVGKILPPFILALGLFSIYLGTLAPGLTWANAGTDGGDLITAAATGGVPHPAGYPTYLLIAGLFQRLPLGSLAFRTNLLSAVAAALAAVVVYAIITWLPNVQTKGNWLAGSIAGWMFGLAPLVWSQAVITEVYTLQALFVALAVFLAAWIPALARPGRWDGLLGVILGLAAGNHLTSIFLIPAALLRGKAGKPWRLDGGALVRGAIGLIIGLMVYAALPLRALTNAPVNWGNPVTLNQFTWLVTGGLYQGQLFDIPFTGILQRLQETGLLLLRQFELPGIVLALIGLIFFFRPTRLIFITLWNAVIFTAFALIYASTDSYLYLIPVILSIAVWIGLGFGGLVNDTLPYFKGFKPLIAVLFSLLLVGYGVNRWPRVDASQDARAETLGLKVVASAPQNALIIAEDDASIFTLWYFHFALGKRPDLVVMARDLLHFEWYDATLRAVYPLASWPEGLFWPQTVAAANPNRPVCTLSSAQGESMTCVAQ